MPDARRLRSRQRSPCRAAGRGSSANRAGVHGLDPPLDFFTGMAPGVIEAWLPDRHRDDDGRAGRYLEVPAGVDVGAVEASVALPGATWVSVK